MRIIEQILFKGRTEELYQQPGQAVSQLTEKHIEEEKERPIELIGSPTLLEKYPYGLPIQVLEMIDYEQFGTLLKQEQLLPPSYDKKPLNVEIDTVIELPRVLLTFKSKTTESVRQIEIYKYIVSYSENVGSSLTGLEVNDQMTNIWYNFAERVMFAWDRGYRNNLMTNEDGECYGIIK